MPVSDELLSLLSLICIRTVSEDLESLQQAEDLATSVAAALGFPNDGRRVPVTAEDIRQSLRRVEQRCERQVHRHEEKKRFRGTVVGWRHVGRRPLLDLDEVLRRLAYDGPLSLILPFWDSPREIGWVMTLVLRMRPKLDEAEIVDLVHRAFGEPDGPSAIEAQRRIDQVRRNLLESGRLKTGRLSRGSYEVGDQYLEMGMEHLREAIAQVLLPSFGPRSQPPRPTHELRFVAPAISRQTVLEILTNAAGPMSQEEIEQEVQQRLEIPDEEAQHVDAGHTRTRFSSIVVWRNGLQSLRDEGIAAEVDGKWSLTTISPNPLDSDFERLKRVVLESLPSAHELPITFLEVVSRVAEKVPGSVLRNRISAALYRLRDDDGLTEMVGDRWRRSSKIPTSPSLASAPIPLAKDAAWPMLDLLQGELAGLTQAEIDRRMHAVFRLDVGAWTFRESPTHQTPKFPYQMELARRALSHLKLIERTAADRWSVTGKGHGAAAADVRPGDVAEVIKALLNTPRPSQPPSPNGQPVPPWPQGWAWPAVEAFRELAGGVVAVDVTNAQMNAALADRLQLSIAARSVGSSQFRGQYEYTTRFDAIRKMLRHAGAIEQGARVQPRPHHLLPKGLTITPAELEAEIAPIALIVLADYTFNPELDALIQRPSEGAPPPPTDEGDGTDTESNDGPETTDAFRSAATALAIETHKLIQTEDNSVAPVRAAGFDFIGWRQPAAGGTVAVFAYRIVEDSAALGPELGNVVRSRLPRIQAHLQSKFPTNGISVTGHVLAAEQLGEPKRQELLAAWNPAGVPPVALRLVGPAPDEGGAGPGIGDSDSEPSAPPPRDDKDRTLGAEEWVTYPRRTGSNESWVSGLIQEIHEAFRDQDGTPFERLCKALMETDRDVESAAMTHLSADQGADLICFDASGEEICYVQCKHWRSGGGSKYNTSPNNIAEFAGKINESYVKYLRHALPVRAIWITTGDVDPSARSDVTRRSLGSRVSYEIWGPEELCIRLLESRDIEFVQLRRAAGDDGLLRELVAVNRKALRAFRKPG